MIEPNHSQFNVRGVDQPSTQDLIDALANGDIRPVFQPKVVLPTNELAGVEALARWHHPSLGEIPPARFVSLAEKAGLIDRLSKQIIDAALKQASTWHAMGLRINVAVNISPLNLNRIDFPDRVAALCEQNGIETDQLTIELTESAAQQAVRLMDTMTRFRLKGMRISLDDFGTGYSSLAQLQQLPFTELKIDRCFVSNAHRSRDSLVIVKSVIDLAHNLEMDVTAEGVEVVEVMDMLVDLKCDNAQGFLFAAPMAGDDLPTWLANRQASACGQAAA